MLQEFAMLPLRTRRPRHALLAASIAVAALTAGCQSNNQAFEYIHLPGTEPAAGANMPFTSAISVGSGRLLYLSGTSGAPVPHSHPHDPREFDDLDFGAEAATVRVMERIKRTVEAAGGEITDVIQVTNFVKDVATNGDTIRDVMNSYWGPNHRPASTTIEIVRVAADPRFVLEVEAVAVIPN
jgi:enamine deaminase RidA (YjgF/YER057c/UK114 family)